MPQGIGYDNQPVRARQQFGQTGQIANPQQRDPAQNRGRSGAPNFPRPQLAQTLGPESLRPAGPIGINTGMPQDMMDKYRGGLQTQGQPGAIGGPSMSQARPRPPGLPRGIPGQGQYGMAGQGFNRPQPPRSLQGFQLPPGVGGMKPMPMVEPQPGGLPASGGGVLPPAVAQAIQAQAGGGMQAPPPQQLTGAAGQGK
jgi:hypothetical protein